MSDVDEKKTALRARTLLFDKRGENCSMSSSDVSFLASYSFQLALCESRFFHGSDMTAKRIPRTGVGTKELLADSNIRSMSGEEKKVRGGPLISCNTPSWCFWIDKFLTNWAGSALTLQTPSSPLVVKNFSNYLRKLSSWDSPGRPGDVREQWEMEFNEILATCYFSLASSWL